MQTKQRLTSDDGELLTDSLVESSELFAQPSDKKKKRGALHELELTRGSFLSSGTFWGVALGYAFAGYGALMIIGVLVIPDLWNGGYIFWALGIPAFLIGVINLLYAFFVQRSWHAIMGQLLGMVLLFLIPLILVVLLFTQLGGGSW